MDCKTTETEREREQLHIVFQRERKIIFCVFNTQNVITFLTFPGEYNNNIPFLILFNLL